MKINALSTRLILILIVMLLIISIIIGLTVYVLTRNILRDTALANLEALASAKNSAIENQIEEYLAFHEIFIDTNTVNNISQLLVAKGEESEQKKEILRKSLRSQMVKIQDLHRVDVANMEEIIIVSTSQELEGILVEDKFNFNNGMPKKSVSRIFIEKGKMFFVHTEPILDFNGEIIAVIFLNWKADAIFEITGEYTGLGNTGETVLGLRQEDKIHFLAPLRFSPDLEKIEPINISGEQAQPMIHATAGQSGTISAKDYRNVSVIAAYRPLKIVDWGVVVKQDVKEIFSKTNLLSRTLIFTTIILIALGVTVIFPISKQFVRPVSTFIKATDAIASNQMETRVSEAGSIEIIKLARSFNHMVEELNKRTNDLQQAQERLVRQKKLALLGQLAGSLSHELRSPLGIISHSAYFLEKELPEPSEQVKKQLDIISRNSKRSIKIINDLLDLSKKKVLKLKYTDITEIISNAFLSIEVPKNVNVKININNDLPDLKVDKSQIEQAFINIINNAIQAMPNGGSLEIEGRVKDNFIEVTIMDTGVGIQKENIQKIFEPLYTTRSKGIGLGLAIVKNIIKGHNGQIEINSKLNKGTKFIIKLPFKKKN